MISSCSDPSFKARSYLICNNPSSCASNSAFFVAALLAAKEVERTDSYALPAVDACTDSALQVNRDLKN